MSNSKPQSEVLELSSEEEEDNDNEEEDVNEDEEEDVINDNSEEIERPSKRYSRTFILPLCSKCNKPIDSSQSYYYSCLICRKYFMCKKCYNPIEIPSTCNNSKQHKLEQKISHSPPQQQNQRQYNNNNNKLAIGNAGNIALEDVNIIIDIQQAVIPDGVNWKDGTCDIFVKVYLKPQKSLIKRELYRTQIVHNTTKPRFENEKFNFTVNRNETDILNGKFIFGVWDYNDDNNNIQHVGDVELSIMDIVYILNQLIYIVYIYFYRYVIVDLVTGLPSLYMKI